MIAPGELRPFLGLDQSLSEITTALATDPMLQTCLEAFPGLRILRQDPWECLITYICSAWNNIPKIERSMQMIAERWGPSHILQFGEEEITVHCFPAAEALATATEAELRGCGLGYRAGYVGETARRIAGGALDLEALRHATYAEALAALLQLPGIGRKVADCILLFALEKTEAVPVDVWVRRVIRLHYSAELAQEWRGQRPSGRGSEPPPGNREYDAIQQLAWRKWGKWAGYAQQYLFHGKRLGII
jgi:N-glycosylase/DNA lyase